MKYVATVEGKEYAIEVQPGGKPGVYSVSLDGRTHTVDVEVTARGWLYSFLIDGHSYQVARAAGQLEVAGCSFEVAVERDLGVGRAAAGGAAAWPARLKAPIPGLVVAVSVTAGDQVREGQALVTVEAMKMQMELKSPRAGHVVEVHVSPGEEVGQGQLLAIIGD